VDGVLDGRWSEWFEGLHIHHQGGQTVLSGTLRDQSELNLPQNRGGMRYEE
jgi:hypothetical protein